MCIQNNGTWGELANSTTDPLRIYMYSRVDGRSLFGFCDAYKEHELNDQASFLSFELMDVKYEKFADVRENRTEGISEVAFEDIVHAAQQKKYNVLMTPNCDRLSVDPKRCFEIVDQLDRLGVYVFSLHEGWINVAEQEGDATKLDRLREQLENTEEAGINRLFDKIIEENIEAFETLA